MHSLCIISHDYPCKANPIAVPFVKQFAHAVARQGVKVTVIAPLPLHRTWRSRDPEHTTERSENGHVIDVFHPRFISASNYQVWKWNTSQIGLESFCRAVGRVLRCCVEPIPEALYGHFLYLGGAAAVRLGHAMGIPAFPMVGDGLLNSMNAFGRVRGRRHLSAATAFMTNSSCLAGLLQRDLDVRQKKIGVFPNGIDHHAFYPRNKAEMRRKLGLPQDSFLAVCVSTQDLQKGPVRVGEAIRGLDGVGGMFLGSGPNPPQADTIIFNAPVPHNQVPDWLSAADVFVLPSTFEGCCNAMLEAMACGLPVIGSLGDFNDDILNDRVSIRVDPFDIPAMRAAIIYLRDNPQAREAMSRAALEWSAQFDVDRRAQGILAFMDHCMADLIQGAARGEKP